MHSDQSFDGVCDRLIRDVLLSEQIVRQWRYIVDSGLLKLRESNRFDSVGSALRSLSSDIPSCLVLRLLLDLLSVQNSLYLVILLLRIFCIRCLEVRSGNVAGN